MNLPPPINWLWILWKRFAEVLGRVMSWFILSVLWILGFGIYAMAFKTLHLVRPPRKTTTYWVDPPKDFPNSMKYQF